MLTKSNDLLLRSLPLDGVKLASGGSDKGTIAGYASTFGGEPDSYGDIIAPGAYADSLAAHKASGTMPVMLWSHQPDAPIGRWLEMREDRVGLLATGQLNLDADRGVQAFAHLKAGDVSGISIGYRVTDRKDNGDGSQTLLKIDLLEASIVTMPANQRARVTRVKSVGSQRELEHLLRDSGLPRTAASRLAAGGWPALAEDDDEEAATALLKALDTSILKLRKS